MIKNQLLRATALASTIAIWAGASWALTAHRVLDAPREGEDEKDERPEARGAAVLTPSSGARVATALAPSGESDSEVVRAEAREKGLDSLDSVPVPRPDNLMDFVVDERVAIALGKALFWDQQVGSDGQACASCHFNAGADNRVKNQLTPGLLRVDDPSGDADPDFTFGDEHGLTGSGGLAGPNYTLVADDYPFHRLEDPRDRESCTDGEDNDGDGWSDFDDYDCFTTNDATTSQGTFSGAFESLGMSSSAHVLTREDCGDADDPTFRVNDIAVRKVEPRNTPTMINAVFNHRNFWDGRANNIFNGLNPLGERGLLPTDDNPNPGILVRSSDGRVRKVQVRINNASLASQAVGPPLSDFEMSCGGRTFADLGRKMRVAQPLAFQTVHRYDSVLGLWREADGTGLRGTYTDLIKRAFKDKYWAGEGRFDANGERVYGSRGYTQMEVNFPLFFGLAIQLYEATLVSDRTPFDRFMKGDDEALTEVEQFGLQTFLNEGKCINCHVGAEFTGATVQQRANEPHGNEEPIERMIMGDGGVALYDGGFYNIGVTPTLMDLGVGASLAGFPIAFARQITTDDCDSPFTSDGSCVIDDFNFDTDKFEVPGDIELGERVAVDGAFKVPTLRNADLTGPYFHDGGNATLTQVVEFYNRGGNRLDYDCGDTTGFAENCSNLDPDIQSLGLDEITREFYGYTVSADQALVEFLLTLTDDRVLYRKAPFDHPQLTVSNGQRGDVFNVFDDGTGRAVDKPLVIPAVGASGSTRPLDTFLRLDP